MSNNLVIVESPAKVKTIKKYLGSSYEVMASNGHVRDLPKSTMGVDVENNYEPKYITIRGKGDLLSKLRKQVKKSDKIYLATDPDREGEAISWHLTKALKLDDSDKKVYRISFNEITKPAIKEAIKNPTPVYCFPSLPKIYVKKKLENNKNNDIHIPCILKSKYK